MAISKHHKFKRRKGLDVMTMSNSEWKSRSNKMKQVMKLTIKEQERQMISEHLERIKLNTDSSSSSDTNEEEQVTTIGSSMGVMNSEK